MIICSFTTGLDEMKRKDQRDVVKVLRVLAGLKRFSCFEATANQAIARTMTLIHHDYKLIRSTGGAYPWVEFELTDAGRAALEAGVFDPPRPAPFVCCDCGNVPRGRNVFAAGGDGPTQKYRCVACEMKRRSESGGA